MHVLAADLLRVRPQNRLALARDDRDARLHSVQKFDVNANT